MLYDIPVIAPWVEDHLPITVEGQVQFPSSNSETKSCEIYSSANTKFSWEWWKTIRTMSGMGWCGTFTWTCRENSSHQLEIQEKRRNQSNANSKVASRTCWVHLTCWGWSFWQPTSRAPRKLEVRGRSRCKQKHSHPGIIIFIRIFSMILRRVMVMAMVMMICMMVMGWTLPPHW